MTHPRLSSSLVEIETRWSLEDVLDAHRALDLWDELEAKAAKAGRKR